MNIEVLYIRGCPHHVATVGTIRDVLQEIGLSADILEVEIADPQTAIARAFPGSPTVRVEGKDVELGLPVLTSFGISCRSYVVDGNRQGIPAREWIRDAIQLALGRQ